MGYLIDPCRSFLSFVRLSASRKVRDEVTNAQNVIMRAGGEEVVKLFSQYSLATSVNYFCCLSDEVKLQYCAYK